MKKGQIQIHQEKERLRSEHKSLLQEEQRKKKAFTTDIELIKSNVVGINNQILGLTKKTAQIESSIKNSKEQRSHLTNKLSQLQTDEKTTEAQIKQISESLKTSENQIQNLQGKVQQLKTLAEEENRNDGNSSASKQKYQQTIKQLTSLKQQAVQKTQHLERAKLRLVEIQNKLKQVGALTDNNVKKQEENIIQIKEVNGLLSKLLNSIELLKKELSLKETQLKKITTENRLSAEKRADLISYLPKVGDDQILFISNEGLQYILNHYDPQTPQKNFNWVSDYRVELPIKLKKTGPGSQQPCTFTDIWNQNLAKFGDLPALTYEASPNNWKSYTFKDYYNNSIRFGKACISLGLTDYSIVMIMGFNSPEWCFSFYGAMFARYLPVGMYTTNSSQTCQYIANHSEGQLVVVEDETQLKKYYNIIDKCPKIKYFVVYNNKVPSNLPEIIKGKVFSWKQFMSFGDKFTPAKKEDDIKYRQSIQKPGNCATFIYTSGTTGMPKAVMTSHDNYIFEIDTLIEHFAMDRPSLYGKGRVLSYLPLSHAAAQLVDLLVPIRCGYNVFFPDSTVLTTGLLKFLSISRPTSFLGVPRVWQKMQQKLAETLSAATGFKKKLIQWAMSIGVEGTFSQVHNRPTPRGWGIAKKLFFNKLKQTLGFEQCEIFLFGAAPMKQTTRKFFLAINFWLNNAYGMSESSGAFTYTNFRNWPYFNDSFLKQTGSLQKGVQIGLDDKDKQGKGEICLRGRNVFMGYYKNVAQTIKTIDRKGYLHSGDEGIIDQKYNLYITGRLKQLIVTAGGENVPPVLIENEITAALPIVSQAVVIGDMRKYLSVLLTLKLKNAEQLTDDVYELIKKHGSQAKTIKQAINCPKVKEMVSKGIASANKKALSKAQNVNKYTILPLQFTVDSGILTPTMKTKRKVVNEMFKAEIQSMYIDSKI